MYPERPVSKLPYQVEGDHVDRIGIEIALEGPLKHRPDVAGAGHVLEPKLYLGTVGDAESRARHGLQQDPQVEAVAHVVALDLELPVAEPRLAGNGGVVDGDLL